MSDCIDPVSYFDMNKCPECGRLITIMDMETAFLELSDDGDPINETTIIRAEAICRYCGYKSPVLRKDDRYVRDNEVYRLQLDFDRTMHMEEVRNRMDSLKPTKDNPFCLYTTGKKKEQD